MRNSPDAVEALVAVIHLIIAVLCVLQDVVFALKCELCFQDVKDEKSSEDQNDHWLLLSGIGQNDCKGDENEWIKPTVIGYLNLTLVYRDLNEDSTVVFVQFSRSTNIRNVVRWVGDDEDENCDAVEEAPWSRYFFRGMIVGFLIGLGSGVLLGFLCWQVQVHKGSYNL
ncbi:unnamed protein product [Wuchereria bancrofti]|uniref:Uncharacterized protein n=1 Tax=Wuchereria bancrofti TaxID=6293 RepID=A0A3P7E3E4_WUCBA|nr:unnamed protein product [Wuchereria bancrofti]